MSFTLWQIYYKDEQQKELYPFATPYFNEGLTIHFENRIMVDLAPSVTTEKVSVCSWKLAKKSRRIYPITPEALDSDYEVLSFTRNGRDHKPIAMASQVHKGFLPALNLLWQKLGIERPGEVRNPIYHNYFSCKNEIYQRYIAEFLKPAIDLIDSDEELNTIMRQPANYGAKARDADLKSVKAKLGMDDYPMSTFVLERCPSLWFDLHRIPVKYL
jgi:hypothetical protein